MGPGVYKTQSKHTKTKSRYRTGTIWLRNASLCFNIEGKSVGKRDGVPVSSLLDKCSSCKFANWPNSAGMGPGVYKTQSKHTKIKSRHRTGTILLRNASLCLNIECKSGEEGWSTGKLVLKQIEVLQIHQLAQFSRDGTWGIQNPVKTYKNQVTLYAIVLWYDLTEKRKPVS